MSFENKVLDTKAFGDALRKAGAARLLKASDEIPGGKADKKKPSDFDAKALEEGKKHEREHTSSDAVAQEIAMDHLSEDPDYYRKLKKVEKSAGIKDERGTVGTTLTGKIHESFTVAADRMLQAGLMSEKERIELSGAIGDMLGKFRKTVNRDVASRTMTPHANDLMKKAILGSMIGTIGGGMVGERLGRMTGYNFAGPVGGALLGGYVGEKMMEPRKRREPKQALDLLRESLLKRSSSNAESEVPVPANLEEPSDREKQLEKNKRVLRKSVSKFGPLYKTKGAQGWDVLAESIATDDQAPGGAQA